MSTQPLTLDVSIGLEKAAFDTRLEKEPSDWAPEIISSAYKTMPFLKSFEMDAELDRVDASRGYGVGKLLVYPMGMEKDAAIKDGSLVVFPIIIREKTLSPFDVFSYEGEFRPMTKEAVERALFRPDVFGAPARKGDLAGGTMSSQIRPPTTGTNRYAGGGLFKASSVLERVAPTIRDIHRHEVIVKVAEHPGLRMVYEQTPALAAALLTIGSGKEKTASDVRVQRRVHTSPDVIQITEKANGYLVKHANSRCYREITETRTAIEVLDLVGQEKMATLREKGSMVLTADPTTQGPRFEKRAQEATSLGVYRALSGTKEIAGIVVPRTVTFEGEVLGQAIFSGSEVHALQKVAGVHVKDITLPAIEPRGRGVFVHQSGALGLATEPVEVENKVVAEKVASYLCKRLTTGEQIEIIPTPGLQKIAHMGGNRYAIPSSMVFLPLRGKQITVQESPEVINHLFSEKVAMDSSTVELVSDGTSFSLRGPNAEFGGYDAVLSREETAFALGALGVHGDQIDTALTKVASTAGAVKIPATRRVVSEDLARVAMIKKAAQVVPNTDHLRKDLVCEAALLCMPKIASAVIAKENLDSVLSLSFVTPENVSVFVESLPDLEKTANRLAEIVIASRIGMDEVREAAARRAMESLNDVIGGLVEIRDKIR